MRLVEHAEVVHANERVSVLTPECSLPRLKRTPVQRLRFGVPPLRLVEQPEVVHANERVSVLTPECLIAHRENPLRQQHSRRVQTCGRQKAAHRSRGTLQVAAVFRRRQPLGSGRKTRAGLVDSDGSPRLQWRHHRGPRIGKPRHKRQVEHACFSIIFPPLLKQVKHPALHAVVGQ